VPILQECLNGCNTSIARFRSVWLTQPQATRIGWEAEAQSSCIFFTDKRVCAQSHLTTDHKQLILYHLTILTTKIVLAANFLLKLCNPKLQGLLVWLASDPSK
jgi:hypothetical protein